MDREEGPGSSAGPRRPSTGPGADGKESARVRVGRLPRKVRWITLTQCRPWVVKDEAVAVVAAAAVVPIPCRVSGRRAPHVPGEGVGVTTRGVGPSTVRTLDSPRLLKYL